MPLVPLYLLLSAWLPLVGQPQQVSCPCREKPTVKEALKSASLVAVGTVVRQEVVPLVDSLTAKEIPKEGMLLSEAKDARHYLVTHKYVLAVEQLFKGAVTADTVMIFSGSPTTDPCALRLVVGEKYLVYGTAETYQAKTGHFRFPSGPGIFWTSVCSRTAPAAAAEITEVGKHIKPKQPKK